MTFCRAKNRTTFFFFFVLQYDRIKSKRKCGNEKKVFFTSGQTGDDTAGYSVAFVVSIFIFRRISNPLYRDMANTDFMTKLKNRNSYETDCQAWARCGRSMHRERSQYIAKCGDK